MTEKMIRELISDKDRFMEYVMNTIAIKDVRERFGIEEKSYKDELGREVFWELNNNYESQQHSIYPSTKGNFRIIYFTRDDCIGFENNHCGDCSEEEFFALVNKI